MDKRVVIRVSKKTAATLKAFAAKRDLDVGQAADRLVKTATGRMEAANRYAKKAAKPSKRASAPKKKRVAKAGPSIKKAAAPPATT